MTNIFCVVVWKIVKPDYTMGFFFTTLFLKHFLCLCSAALTACVLCNYGDDQLTIVVVFQSVKFQPSFLLQGPVLDLSARNVQKLDPNFTCSEDTHTLILDRNHIMKLDHLERSPGLQQVVIKQSSCIVFLFTFHPRYLQIYIALVMVHLVSCCNSFSSSAVCC